MPSKIRNRGNNNYQFFVPNGYDATGKQQGFIKTVTASNQTEAKALYDLFLRDCVQGKVLASSIEKMTLSQFYDYWKEKFAIARYAKTTMACYNQVFVRINAALGHLRIDKIKPIQLVDFFAQLSKQDAKNNDTPFTDRSIAKYRELLQLLFSSALKWELTTSNPLEKLDKPRTRKKQKEIPTQEEVVKFFDCLSKAPLKSQLMCMLAFAGGLRREELSALKQGDFNAEKNTAKIERAATYIPGEGIHIGLTKTNNSERTISLPISVMKLRESYNAEIKALAMRRAKRNKVVLLDDPISSDKWLFSQPDGSIGHPHALNSFLKKFCFEHDLFNFTPHLLRHLHGSYLLRNGMDIAAVSKSLGHSKKSFTLDTYIHTIETIEDETASVMQNVLSSIKSQKKHAK
ncbi:site-specific integrase [Pelosinus sp. UFO1]|uniref:tyrosine-type recombinase/integrase n=1 Tax=Pelosinus sp. UFO1 TaxID=484770 RepID=UPI0004D10223|nr:site-specific integrase [Pelosinus sp. UFO1]AIF51212.1 integrase family protein [Pelosinus sp. UFO1]